MEWIIGILAAFLILLLLKLVGILRQIRDICRQLTFLKDYDSNLMITGQEASGPLRELMDELNEMLDRQREQRRRYLKKEQDISDAYTNLSHDIRTPLTSLNGYFRLLEESEDPKERARYLSVIEERINSLKEMLEELFTYTKLKNETYVLEMEPLYLNRIVTETVFSYYDVWMEKGIEPEIDFSEEQMKIEGNAAGLRRTLQNIIKNGMDHGTGKMRITLKRQDQWAVVECINYVEHPEEIEVEKVFERFYKADEARSRTSSGLGLSIAKAFTGYPGASSGKLVFHLPALSDSFLTGTGIFWDGRSYNIINAR